MKKGFTLLELLIVIIIVGVLATIGFTQYSAVIERSRGAEARQILGQLRSMCSGMYMADQNAEDCTAENLTLSSGAPTQDQIPGDTCAPSHYFKYSVTEGADEVVFTATRCIEGENGKEPPAPSARTLELTTNYAAGGTDSWVNTFGY